MSKKTHEPKSEVETKIPEYVSDAIRIGRQTLKGDLRDIILEIFKNRPKP